MKNMAIYNFAVMSKKRFMQDFILLFSIFLSVKRSFLRTVSFCARKYIWIFSAAVFLILAGSCSCFQRVEKLRIANWNVQTFFDAAVTGSEYSDFVKSKNWNSDAYSERLDRLCSSIIALNADVVVLEEIENSTVISDIFDFISAKNPFGKNYDYGCFASVKDSCIGIAVLSRYPLDCAKTHAVEVRGQSEKQPSMRPILELTVLKNGKRLHIFANHWKSMSGGREKTEVWRDLQEKLLADEIVRSCDVYRDPFIVCGDFNRDVCDFSEDDGFIILHGNCSDIEVSSPWYEADGTELNNGSYYYNGSWSKIDNFFAGQNVCIKDFAVENKGDWCDKNTGIPYKYKIWNGFGYSDHLPITCTVEF